MARFLASLSVVCLLALSSCQQPNKAFVSSVSDAWNILRPYTAAGIAGAPDLDVDQRANRLALVEELTKTIQEAANAK